MNYSAGSAFTARAVFDDSFADTNPDSATGSFFDFGTATSALVSFELTTELGTVSYDPSAVQGAAGTILAPRVGQIQTTDRQTVSVTSHGGGDPVNNGWSGSLGTLVANNFTLTLLGSGVNNYFFDDPNALFSGAADGFSTDADLLGGIITAAQFGGFDNTELFFAAGEYSIVAGEGDLTVSPVPLPASLPLMAFGLLGLGWAARRKKSKEC